MRSLTATIVYVCALLSGCATAADYANKSPEQLAADAENARRWQALGQGLQNLGQQSHNFYPTIPIRQETTTNCQTGNNGGPTVKWSCTTR